MANKLIALLLLASLVASVQGQNVNPENEVKMTPEECFNYCYNAMLMPKVVAESICKFRCKYTMYEEEPDS